MENPKIMMENSRRSHARSDETLWKPVETWTFDHTDTSTVWKDCENYYQISHPSRDGTFDLNDLPTPSPSL